MTQREIGELLATQRLILEELKDQRKRLHKIEVRVYAWGGAFALLSTFGPFLLSTVAKAMGF